MKIITFIVGLLALPVFSAQVAVLRIIGVKTVSLEPKDTINCIPK